MTHYIPQASWVRIWLLTDYLQLLDTLGFCTAFKRAHTTGKSPSLCTRRKIRFDFLADLLRDPTLAVTVFAPTNAAFEAAAAQLGLGIQEFLTSPQIVPIIMYHVVGHKIPVRPKLPCCARFLAGSRALPFGPLGHDQLAYRLRPS